MQAIATCTAHETAAVYALTVQALQAKRDQHLREQLALSQGQVTALESERADKQELQANIKLQEQARQVSIQC